MLQNPGLVQSGYFTRELSRPVIWEGEGKPSFLQKELLSLLLVENMAKRIWKILEKPDLHKVFLNISVTDLLKNIYMIVQN